MRTSLFILATALALANVGVAPTDAKSAKTAKAATVTLADGLKYTDLAIGKGPQPRSGQTVVVHYIGTLTSGKKFDSSRDRGTPFEFQLGRGAVIAGWDEGVATMRVGGRRKLVIPAKLGYGAAGAGDGAIPPNATLLFDIELLAIK